MTYGNTEESAIIEYAGRTYKILYKINKDNYWLYFKRTWLEERKLVAKFDTLKECLQYIVDDL